MPDFNGDKLLIVLNPDSDDVRYAVYPISQIRDAQTKPSISISPPGASYKENLLMGVSGQETEMDIEFYLHDDGEDKSHGTHPRDQNVVSLSDQIEYLKDEIHESDFDTSWELYTNFGLWEGYDFNNEDYDSEPRDEGLEVFIEDVNLTILNENSPKWLQGTIRIKVGEGIV